MEKHALALDNLLSVEAILADGCMVTASKDDNPDLFWALRGGSGNFGVAATFEYRLHAVGPMVARWSDPFTRSALPGTFFVSTET